MTDSATTAPEDMAERFARARRVGRPQWLWPDLEVSRWSAALDSIESAIRHILDPRNTGPFSALSDDAEALGIACYTSGTGPLLGSWIEQGRLTVAAPVRNLLARHLMHNRARMRALTERAREAVEALAADGIDPTLLKGLHTAHAYFDEPGQRAASDIDIFVNPEQIDRAKQVLAALGYRPGKEGVGQCIWARPEIPSLPKTLSFIHRGDPWAIDLQTMLDRRLAGGARMVRLDRLERGLPRAPWSVAPQGRVLPQPLLLMHLAAHASCSFGSLTLQRQFEIATVIRRDLETGQLSWAAFRDMGCEGGALGYVYPALLCCERLAPGLIPPSLLESSRAAAPAKVRAIIDGLAPARAQLVARWSIGEQYMWADDGMKRLRQFVDELFPFGARAPRQLAKLYQGRLYRALHRTIAW